MRPVFLTTLLICATFTGCRKHRVVVSPSAPAPAVANTLVEGAVIKGGGNWYYADRETHHSLTTTVSGKVIGWRHESSGRRSKGGSISSAISLSSPTLPWFIYAEAPDTLWFFDGSGSLSYRSFNPDDFGEAISEGKLQVDAANIPPGLVPHLPANLQKLFPKLDNKPRPSI